MRKTAFVFGAGKTGRGFAAHQAYLSGYEIILVDKDKSLVKKLKEEGQYTVEVLGNPSLNCEIKPKNVFYVDENWIPDFIESDLAFISVFGNNLEELSLPLSKGLSKWIEKNSGNLNIITCENLTHAASFLEEKVRYHLNEEDQAELGRKVGFCESIILRTCLSANEPNSLTVRAQNFLELPCDGEAFKGKIPPIKGLKPLNYFGHQLQRKIYTYNCINAVISYMGAKKGFTELWEAGNDRKIIEQARKAAYETSEAQIREYGFDRDEQNEWVAAAFSKFSDKAIPDPIDRNGADPIRKLSRNDRLIGPALLAIKHGINPEGLITGILAGLHFRDQKIEYSIIDDIQTEGIDVVLMEICGLRPEEELFSMIKKRYTKPSNE